MFLYEMESVILDFATTRRFKTSLVQSLMTLGEYVTFDTTDQELFRLFDDSVSTRVYDYATEKMAQLSSDFSKFGWLRVTFEGRLIEPWVGFVFKLSELYRDTKVESIPTAHVCTELMATAMAAELAAGDIDMMKRWWKTITGIDVDGIVPDDSSDSDTDEHMAAKPLTLRDHMVELGMSTRLLERAHDTMMAELRDNPFMEVST
jgi:hypothetical protein